MRRDEDPPSPPITPTVERLAASLLDPGVDPRFGAELRTWLAGSPPFRAFAESHRAKIRKKLRGAADPDALLDVRAELRVAELLLRDRRIGLAFEAFGSGRRGPDFTVTFRSAPGCTLEVTRRRGGGDGDATRYGTPLLAKLRQLPPGVPNAVLLAVAGEMPDAEAVAAAVRAIRARADAKDEAFFAARGLEGTRTFYDRFLRLGAVIVWNEAAAGASGVATWTNGSARTPIAAHVVRAISAALTER
jgi:hypothetical protein